MLSTLRKFNKLLDEKQKKKIFLLFIIMLMCAFMEVLGVSMLLPIIKVLTDDSLMESNPAIVWVCNMLNIRQYEQFVIFCLVVLIAIYVIKGLFTLFENYLQVRFVCNNRLAMQRKLLNIVMRRPYEFFLDAKTGEVTQMVVGDAKSAYELLAKLLTMITNMIVSLALSVTIFVVSPGITLVVVAILLVCMLIITKVARPAIKSAGKTYRKFLSASNNWVVQIVNGIKEIKIAQNEDFFEKEYARISKEGIKAEKKFKTINGIPKALIETVTVSGTLIVLVVMLLKGESLIDLVPTLSVFCFAAIKLLPCVNKIAIALNDITYAQPNLEKLISNIEYLEAEITRTKEEAERLGTLDHDITLDEGVEMSGLMFHYPSSEKMILEDAKMSIPAGKSVGIVGTTGSGKTTTVDILLGLLKPQEGLIAADGQNVMLDYKQWLRNIGYIPQSIFILDGSIRDNVAFGVPKKEIDDEKVWAAIREAQLEKYVKELPDGLDSSVGERGLKISGGQRQRIGIARALYFDPQLLVFDEATSALDNETEAAIMESINSLHGKKTMVIIAHRLQTIEGCDMVYRVEDGTIKRER